MRISIKINNHTMDCSVLLNNSEFDENKLKLLETLVETLYKTTNNNDRVFANQILNEYKNLESSWLSCDKILTISNHILTKVFAVSILEDLVKSKFNLLADDQKGLIRNFLVDVLIKTINITTSNTSNPSNDQINTLINKLNMVIVAIAKSEWATTWKSFMTEICSSGKTSQELCENNLKLLLILK